MALDNLQDNLVLVVALAVLGGLLIGWLITYLVIGRGPSKTELTGKLAAVEEEFETHKSDVDKHFATTSELVNELTESYVKVYKHLSEGAEQLGGVVDMRHRLTLDDGEASNTKSHDDDKIIEGALATGAATGAAHADDPEFAASDAGVAETLTELEASAVDDLPDVAAIDDIAGADIADDGSEADLADDKRTT